MKYIKVSRKNIIDSCSILKILNNENIFNLLIQMRMSQSNQSMFQKIRLALQSINSMIINLMKKIIQLINIKRLDFKKKKTVIMTFKN